MISPILVSISTTQQMMLQVYYVQRQLAENNKITECIIWTYVNTAKGYDRNESRIEDKNTKVHPLP